MELSELLHTDRTAVCVDSGKSLQASAKLMTAAHSGCLFILDAYERLVGVFTDGDLRRAVEAGEAMKPWGGVVDPTITQVMTSQPLRLPESASLVDAFRLFQQHGINTLPVLDSNGKYLGYVEFHEVAAALSPERIYPRPGPWGADEDENVRRHRARYEFAAQFVERGGVVLDCACGSGYGSEILASKAAVVVAVDKSEEAINYAKAHHASPKIYYNCIRLEDLHWERGGGQVGGYPDVVVTLETLEHVSEDVCRLFLRDAGQWIKPGGVLVASSPMLRYRDGRPYVTSPYHVNEMPKAGLLVMFSECLPGYTIHYYHQKQDTFLPLLDEVEGFMVVVARRVQ